MKYAISFFFVLSAQAAPIKVFYEEERPHARLMKEVLIRDYKIPEDLIEIRKTRGCEDLTGKGKLDLCLKNNGDLILVSVDRGFVNESLKIFRAP